MRWWRRRWRNGGAAASLHSLVTPSHRRASEASEPRAVLRLRRAGWANQLGGGCGGAAVTHTAPMENTTWRFLWTPGSTSGTVTFSAAVAASFEDTFLVTACLPDLQQASSSVGYVDTSTGGRKLLHARAGRALRQSSSEHAHHHGSSVTITSCVAGVDSSMMHQTAAMPSAFTAAAKWSCCAKWPVGHEPQSRQPRATRPVFGQRVCAHAGRRTRR